MLLDPITIAATLSDTTKAILRERYREDFVNFGYDNSETWLICTEVVTNDKDDTYVYLKQIRHDPTPYHVVSHITCPLLCSSPHASAFVRAPAVIDNNALGGLQSLIKN
jgi:hypothetical protein